MGITHKEYKIIVDTVRKTVNKKVEECGWDKSEDEIGILVGGLKITREVWELGEESYEEYTKLVKDICKLRDR